MPAAQGLGGDHDAELQALVAGLVDEGLAQRGAKLGGVHLDPVAAAQAVQDEVGMRFAEGPQDDLAGVLGMRDAERGVLGDHPCERRAELVLVAGAVGGDGERQERFGWHRAMMLPGADMQISFVKDLVSLPLSDIKATHEGWLPAYMNATD